MVRVVIPFHLRTLAQVDGEVKLDLDHEAAGSVGSDGSNPGGRSHRRPCSMRWRSAIPCCAVALARTALALESEIQWSDAGSEPRIHGVPPMTVKEMAKQVIESLPQDSTLDDIIHALYIKAKFDRGEQEIREGGGVSDANARQRLRKWVA